MENLISNCNACNSSSIHYQETEFETGFYCNSCDTVFTEAKQFDGCCSFPLVEPMKVAISKGFSFREVCQNCYTTVSTLKKTDLINPKILNITLADLHVKNFAIKRYSLRSILFLFRETAQQQKQTAFWVKYKEYLVSDKWKVKRIKILERDNNICQACLRNKATQVHHLTYERVFDEPMYDLISICSPCHEKLHKK